MSLETWNQLHKGMNMSTKQKPVQFLVNVGTNDYQRLQLNFDEDYLEGDVKQLDEPVADRLIQEKIAVEWTEDRKREDEKRRQRIHDDAVRAALPEAERKAAAAEAEEKAKAQAATRRSTAAANIPPTAATVAKHPHTPTPVGEKP